MQVAKQRCVEYRSAFMADIFTVSSRMVVWLDVTGCICKDFI